MRASDAAAEERGGCEMKRDQDTRSAPILATYKLTPKTTDAFCRLPHPPITFEASLVLTLYRALHGASGHPRTAQNHRKFGEIACYSSFGINSWLSRPPPQLQTLPGSVTTSYPFWGT